MSLKDIIQEGISALLPLYPEREAREMVLLYLEDVLGISRHTHIIEPYHKIGEDDVRTVRDAFRRMASGEPLQYVSGKAFFYGREFSVCPDVLIPRQETEILCRTVIESVCGKGRQVTQSPLRVLDLCTGSGCIAWTLALEMPGTQVTAIDISDGALSVASSQNFADEISRTAALAPHFVKADVLDPEASGFKPEASFDILVSNPPYVMESEKALMRSNVLEYEPHLALFVSDDDPLVFYRAVAGWASMFLKPGGSGIVEINEALSLDTEEVFREMRFSDVRTIYDLNDKPRFVSFRRPL